MSHSFAKPILLTAVLLTGCGERTRALEANGRDIACGPLGKPADVTCRLDVVDDKGNLQLTLRQPEGGFRKLLWPKGGTLTASDGAEPLTTAPLAGGGVEARIGGWAYRIERKGGGLP
jgi:hypothetical protein